MNSLNRFTNPSEMFNPGSLDQIFPLEHQRTYISMLMGRGGLTRRRAEYFVRLWAYLFIKQAKEVGTRLAQPLTQLQPIETSVTCTHREAAELFYGHKERGSDRAAGMMIDRLVALGLLNKRFDGHTLCLQIPALPELTVPKSADEPVTVFADQFNPRTDVIPIANLFTRSYAELIRDSKDASSVSFKFAKSLRQWSKQYPHCLRVLRRSDNLSAVATSILYPVSANSELHFFQPPGKSFYFTTEAEVDPFQMAEPGDLDCTSVFVRAWMIDPAYMNATSLFQLLDDSKQVLVKMQEDFPSLCNLYSLVVNPTYEQLRVLLGFQKTFQDPQRSYYWIYLALDHFLAIDIRQALTKLKGTSKTEPDS